MDLKPIFDAVVDGKFKAVEEGVRAALAEGVPADRILHEALIPAMGEVGQRFEVGKYYVPEMLLSAKAMQSGLKILRPLLAEDAGKGQGRVVFGTVKGDLHDIGKNLVVMMMEGAGFQVTDLGVDVPPAKFVDAARGGAQIIGMSAMLTTTMPNMQQVMDALGAAGLRDQVKVMVGGAPLTPEYANQIGADGYARDASAAVRKAKELIA
jgi:5-methyltetrahydrofolate--homocysteine methyltransferase